jgi:competence protein ComEC
MKLPTSLQLFFAQTPFLRIVFPFALGIFAQLHFEWSNIIPFIIPLSIVIAAYAIFQFSSLKISFKWFELNGILIQLILFFSGIIITQTQFVNHQSDYYGNLISPKNKIVQIRLLENPIEKAGSYKALADVEFIHQQSVSGKTIVYFNKSNFEHRFIYGDILLVPNHFTKIKNSGNPGCFNYKFSCFMQDVTHQIFINEADCEKLNNRHNGFYKQLWQVRDSILSIIEQNVTSEKELGVAQALLIGYRDNLDKDLQQVYSNTGIVHVLAISGMHLGLIFWMLNKALFFLDKRRKSKWIKSIIILTIIWLFALLTGASGSVMRAAVMFTFVQAALLMKRNSSIYNSLAASAFIMLVFNPFILADVGFQLSYIAVIGIISLQKFIYDWIYIKNWIAKKIWNLIAVSIAAQILAAPICMLYFHQFPNYFLLANLIAIPISTIVLFEIIGMLIVAKFSVFWGGLIGKLITFTTWLMNTGVEWVDGLPHSVINNLQFNVWQILLMYSSIIAFVFWLVNKNVNYLKVSMIAFLIMLVWLTSDKIETQKQQKIIVYAIPKGSAIDFIQGNEFAIFQDSLVLANHITQNFHIKPSRVLHQATSINNALMTKVDEQSLVAFNQRITYLGRKEYCFEFENKIETDILIVAHNSIYSVNDLLKKYKFKQLIFDSSNSNYKVKKWMNEAANLHLAAFNTIESGAFEMNIQ